MNTIKLDTNRDIGLLGEILMLEFINNNIDANHFLAKKTKEFLSSEIKKREVTLA